MGVTTLEVAGTRSHVQFPLLLVAAAGLGFSQSSLDQLRAKVDHIIVIYQENWSFDCPVRPIPRGQRDRQCIARVPRAE